MLQALALFLTSVQLFLGGGRGIVAWEGTAPWGREGRGCSPGSGSGGVASSSLERFPPPKGQGKRPQEVSKQRLPGGFSSRFTTHPLPLQKLPTSRFLPATLSLFLFPPVRVLRYLHFSSVFKIFHSKWALVKGNGRSDAHSNAASKNPAITFILHHGNILVQICIAQL